MPALLMSDSEVAEVQRRLVERDPELDLPRAVPRLIATLHERQAEAQRAKEAMLLAQAEVAEVTRRLEAIGVGVTRRDAVIKAARRSAAGVAAAMADAQRVYAAYDRGDVVIPA